MTRSCATLLHPTSLPGPYGIGDLGPEAYRFVDYLAGAGVTGWQMLPVAPGECPYSALSAFAGNPLLISMDRLVEDGLLAGEQLADVPAFPAHQVDLLAVAEYKHRKLREAFLAFREKGGEAAPAYRAFCREHADWLDDYALFMAVREAQDGRSWTAWPVEIARRNPSALAQWRKRLAEEIAYHRFLQYLFFAQWDALLEYTHEHHVQLIGDMPIFVAHDSADVWAHPGLFNLDSAGQPTVVAGVPPDFFTPTGQRWGNPLYDWEAHAATGFAWWIERFRHSLRLVDCLRIDHFRGFAACWAVPAKEKTAKRGHWAPAPGTALFQAVKDALGQLPLIAEDLGLITPDVVTLRKGFGIPGMAVLQYAFAADRKPSPYQPHRYTEDTVAYTGTHDNDTIVGWWTRTPETCGETQQAIDASRQFAREYLQTGDWEIHWAFMRAAIASTAGLVIFPLQDLFALGNDARMNYPGRPHGNWAWRITPDHFTHEPQERLRWLLTIYERTGTVPAEQTPDLLRLEDGIRQ